MSSWIYAYLFPHPDVKLNTEDAFTEFLTLGMEVDSAYVELIKDSNNHCVEGNLFNISGSSIEQIIADLLQQDKSIQVVFRNTEIFISSKFAVCGTSPYICFSYSKRLFLSLSDSSKNHYLQGIKKVSKVCGATYVIFLEDVPNYFEDHFIFIDTNPYIDPHLSNGRLYLPEAIWVDLSQGASLPEGIDFFEGNEIGEGFSEYQVKK